jgi:hypothetical protein
MLTLICRETGQVPRSAFPLDSTSAITALIKHLPTISERPTTRRQLPRSIRVHWNVKLTVPNVKNEIHFEWSTSWTFFEFCDHDRLIKNVGTFLRIGGNHLGSRDISVLINQYGNSPS